jgi:hypothetical protein
LDLTDGYIPVPFVPNWVVDWETPEAAIVTETAFEIGVKGQFFDKRIGEEHLGVLIPDMPYKLNEKSQAFQTFISSYDFDAFFSSMLDVVDAEFTIKYDELPGLQITTSVLNILLPGIEEYYGKDVPVDVNVQIQKISDFTVSEGDS